MRRVVNVLRRPAFRLLLVLLIVAGAAAYWIGTPSELRVYALDAQSGKVVWSLVAAADQPTMGSAAPSNGRVFIATAINPPDDKLYEQYGWKLTAYAADSGARLWEYTVDEPVLGQISASFWPVPVGETVLATLVTVRQNVRLIALDAATGQVRWSVDGLYYAKDDFFGLNRWLSGETRYAPVVVAGSTIYAVFAPEAAADNGKGTSTGILTALDASTGAKQWSVPFGERRAVISAQLASVFVSEKTLFVTAFDKLYAFNRQSGALLYASEPARGVVVSAAGTLYMRNYRNAITALDEATGRLKWRFAPSGEDSLLGCTNLNADAQRVYTFCEMKGFNDKLSDAEKADPSQWTSLILALDASTGRELWRKPAAYNLYTLVWQKPVLVRDSVMFVGGVSDSYRLMALAQQDGSVRWSFALHRGSDAAFTDGERVYVMDRAPRWRYWAALLNPAWH
ncbi:MAG: PQQ-like beta-propeller repeat protein [Anaerolineae bacterium]|nr:PQQ-like beta-propeller repeat protein [Anaerolineae bacterium]